MNNNINDVVFVIFLIDSPDTTHTTSINLCEKHQIKVTESNKIYFIKLMIIWKMKFSIT
jgi:hypothetical protein